MRLVCDTVQSAHFSTFQRLSTDAEVNYLTYIIVKINNFNPNLNTRKQILKANKIPATTTAM